MEKKNAHKLDPKWINKLFIWIAFICVFLFTVSFSIPQVKNNLMWWGIALAITVVVVAAIWVTLYLVARKQSLTENDKKIKEALKQKQKENDTK